MNRLEHLLHNEYQHAIELSEKDIEEFDNYLGTGSILASVNMKENQSFCEVHGSLAGQLLVLCKCVRAMSKHQDIPVIQILDYMTNIMAD